MWPWQQQANAIASGIKVVCVTLPGRETTRAFLQFILDASPVVPALNAGTLAPRYCTFPHEEGRICGTHCTAMHCTTLHCTGRQHWQHWQARGFRICLAEARHARWARTWGPHQVPHRITGQSMIEGQDSCPSYRFKASAVYRQRSWAPSSSTNNHCCRWCSSSFGAARKPLQLYSAQC